jgi:peptide/nickel transport system substrate-binding protein
MSSKDGQVEILLDEYLARRIDRRLFLRRAAALGLSLPTASALLAACGGDEEAARTAPTATGKAAPTGGTLRIRILNDVINLDPPFFPASADEITSQGIYEGLVTYKPRTWEVVNQLAETFEPSADGLRFHFELKQGIPFHGGYGEVTAEDVKFSYERTAGLTKPKIDSPYSGDWRPLEQVKLEGKYAGTIILKERFVPIMRTTLPVFSGWIVSKKAVEDRGKKYATNPIGTGQYEFVEWKRKQSIRLKRFEDYGGASSDLIETQWDELVFHPIEKDSASDIALETGELDFSAIALASIGRWEENEDFTVHKRTSLDYNWIGMNIRNPKLQDINVRQAIRYAIDVPAILEAAFEGRWTRATALLPSAMEIGYWKDAPVYERDVEQAKSFLEQAANPPSTLELKMAEETGSKEVGEITQANLAEIGIKLDIKVMDTSAFYALEKEELRSRELIYIGFITSPDPSWSTVWFTCDQIDVWNWMYWCDKEYDRLHFAALKETDPEKRHEMYVQMQELWDQAVHTVWIGWPTLYYAAREGIDPGIRPDGRLLPSAFRSVGSA